MVKKNSVEVNTAAPKVLDGAKFTSESQRSDKSSLAEQAYRSIAKHDVRGIDDFRKTMAISDDERRRKELDKLIYDFDTTRKEKVNAQIENVMNSKRTGADKVAYLIGMYAAMLVVGGRPKGVGSLEMLDARAENLLLGKSKVTKGNRVVQKESLRRRAIGSAVKNADQRMMQGKTPFPLPFVAPSVQQAVWRMGHSVSSAQMPTDALLDTIMVESYGIPVNAALMNAVTSGVTAVKTAGGCEDVSDSTKDMIAKQFERSYKDLRSHLVGNYKNGSRLNESHMVDAALAHIDKLSCDANGNLTENGDYVRLSDAPLGIAVVDKEFYKDVFFEVMRSPDSVLRSNDFYSKIQTVMQKHGFAPAEPIVETGEAKKDNIKESNEARKAEKNEEVQAKQDEAKQAAKDVAVCNKFAEFFRQEGLRLESEGKTSFNHEVFAHVPFEGEAHRVITEYLDYAAIGSQTIEELDLESVASSLTVEAYDKDAALMIYDDIFERWFADPRNLSQEQIDELGDVLDAFSKGGFTVPEHVENQNTSLMFTGLSIARANVKPEQQVDFTIEAVQRVSKLVEANVNCIQELDPNKVFDMSKLDMVKAYVDGQASHRDTSGYEAEIGGSLESSEMRLHERIDEHFSKSLGHEDIDEDLTDEKNRARAIKRKNAAVAVLERNDAQKENSRKVRLDNLNVNDMDDATDKTEQEGPSL